MCRSGRGKAIFTGGAALLQAIVVVPAFATEPAPIDDTVLNQTTATREDAERHAPPRRERARSSEHGERSGTIARIVETGETELPRTPNAEAPLTLQPLTPAPEIPAAGQNTNFVISATLTAPDTATRP